MKNLIMLHRYDSAGEEKIEVGVVVDKIIRFEQGEDPEADCHSVIYLCNGEQLNVFETVEEIKTLINPD